MHSLRLSAFASFQTTNYWWWQ